MKTLASKFKVFIIAVLVVLVAGMAMLGFLGFNQTIDHKNGYEVRVSVEQKIDKALTVMEKSAEEYFSSKGIAAVEYAVQKMDDGKVIVYKFEKDVKINEAELAQYIQGKLDAADGIEEITASAEYSEVIGYNEFEAGWLLLGLGVGIVAAFIYALIMEKLSGSLAVLSSSVLAALVFVAMMSIVRLPAYPTLGVGVALAAVVGAVMSLVSVSKCKEEYKSYTMCKLWRMV